jgi:hypothetical protein
MIPYTDLKAGRQTACTAWCCTRCGWANSVHCNGVATAVLRTKPCTWLKEEKGSFHFVTGLQHVRNAAQLRLQRTCGVQRPKRLTSIRFIIVVSNEALRVWDDKRKPDAIPCPQKCAPVPNC